jgi:glyoxalase family protein
MRFDDPEGQRLTLVDDRGAPFEGQVWDGAGVPAEYALRGFYGVALSVPRLDPLEMILTRILNWEEISRGASPGNPAEEVVIYGMDGGGPGREVSVFVQPNAPRAWLGRGGVHHVAFRVSDDAEQAEWVAHLHRVGLRTSGVIDRFYFKSVYFRVSNGILFELATDGPGFAADEPADALGERLALPPFLEPRRAQIEAGLRPLPTP